MSEEKGNKQPGAGSTAVDLGLGSLLDSAHSKVEAVVTPITEQQPNPDKVESENEKLAREQQWDTLLAQTELLLEDQQLRLDRPSQWIESQSWWIIAQLHSAKLPLAVLAAPVEGLLENSLEISSRGQEGASQCAANIELVKRTVAEFASALFARGEMQQGMQLLSRARVLGGDLTVLSEPLKKFAQPLRDLQGSEQRLFAILCKELSFHPAYDSHSSSVSSSSPLPIVPTMKDNTGAAPTSSSSRGARKPIPMWVSTALIFVVLLCLLSGFLWKQFSQKQPTPLPIASTLSLPKADLEVPPPAPVAQPGKLDALLIGLSSKKTDAKIENKVSATKPAANPQAPVGAPQRKEKLNTDGPKEAENVRVLREQSDRDSTNSQSQKREESSLPIPGPAEAPRFENFPSSKVFQVVRATNVMTRPSVNSEAVAGLKPRDRVRVEGREGYWLRIRSKQGKVAFVLAEDVVPER